MSIGPKEPLPPKAPPIRGKRTRGLQIRISLGLLLDWMGLERGNIQLGAVMIDVNQPDVLIMVLRGDDERLPEVDLYQTYPKGTVICTRTDDKPGIQGEIKVEA